MRSHLLLFAPVVLLAAACQPQAPEYREIPYPKLGLNQDTLEFGSLEFGESAQRTVIISNDGYTILQDVYVGMDMGVGSRDEALEGVDIGPGMAENFSVAYDVDDITCPEGAGGEDTGDAATADGKADTGTGGGDDDDDETGTSGGDETGGGGGGGGGGGNDGDAYALFVLPAGCSIPVTVTFSPSADVGDIWGSLVVNSVQADQTEEQIDANELPEYLRDPIRFTQQVYLHGEAEQGQGTIVVTPRSFDYGYVYPNGETDIARVGVHNVGTGDITLATPTLSDTCGSEFAITSAYGDGSVLPAGEASLVEVEFTPTDDSPSICELTVNSNDPANSAIKVTLKGNTGANPNNSPPTAAIRWPQPGYEYNTPSALEIELNVFDKDQPAESLTCKVKSSLMSATIADCTPVDDSGHMVVAIDREVFDSGVDTLTVVVTDADGITGEASVSVLINSQYPDSDDDGDAYGVEGDLPDCDDQNRDTYPDAAEVFDGEDNDCDGIVDEGTEGADDDGDSWSEADGDCNDYNAQAYPGAPERADSVDNDCDGVVDESTALYDDDGDGFAEVNNDCDDSDPDVNPSSEEVCDGLDNDCDGLYDSADACVSTDSEPMVIGYPRPSQNACLAGEQISFSVKIFDADGQLPSYSWGSDDPKGSALFDNPIAQTVNFTCPEPSSAAGENVTVYVLVMDPDGHQVWGDTKIAVYPADYGLYDPYTEVIVDTASSSGGAGGLCAGSPFAVLAGLGVGGAIAMRRRRA